MVKRHAREQPGGEGQASAAFEDGRMDSPPENRPVGRRRAGDSTFIAFSPSHFSRGRRRTHQQRNFRARRVAFFESGAEGGSRRGIKEESDTSSC